MMGSLFLIIVLAIAFNKFLAAEQIPQQAAQAIKSAVSEPWQFLILVNLFLLALGFVMEIISAILIVAPLLAPIAHEFGIDPIHLGVLFALCIEMGAVIPPVGLNLFAVSGTTGVPVTTVMRGSFPFLCSDGCVLILCMLFPLITLWLPNLVVKPIFG